MSGTDKKTYIGSCHCGAVQFEIHSALEEVYTCSCSLCIKKNAVMVGVHKDNFRLLHGEDQLDLYQWNTKIARHHFCKICGIYPFHRRRITPDEYGINLYCLDDLDFATLDIRAYDGESLSTDNNKG